MAWDWPHGDLSHRLGPFSSHCSASIPSEVHKEGLNFRIAFSRSFKVNATGRHAGLAQSQPFYKDAFALVESHSLIFMFIPLTIHLELRLSNPKHQQMLDQSGIMGKRDVTAATGTRR